jgi:hypothetical protein
MSSRAQRPLVEVNKRLSTVHALPLTQFMLHILNILPTTSTFLFPKSLHRPSTSMAITIDFCFSMQRISFYSAVQFRRRPPRECRNPRNPGLLLFTDRSQQCLKAEFKRLIHTNNSFGTDHLAVSLEHGKVPKRVVRRVGE